MVYIKTFVLEIFSSAHMVKKKPLDLDIIYLFIEEHNIIMFFNKYF